MIEVIQFAFDQHWRVDADNRSTVEIAPGIWLLVDKRPMTGVCSPVGWRRHSTLQERDKPPVFNYSLWVSCCPGGAYHYFACAEPTDVEAILTTTTVWGIIRRNSRSDKYHFAYCNPEFPDNLYDFIVVVAKNALRCFDLEHKRAWARIRRRQVMEDFQEGNRACSNIIAEEC